MPGRMSSAAVSSTLPRPMKAPMSSAATSVIHAVCSDSRRPVKIMGMEPGIRTSRSMRTGLPAPCTRAASISVGSMLRTPA